MGQSYEDIKAKQAAKQRAISKSGRDVGNIPPVKAPKRRKNCERSFKRFFEVYFPAVFAFKWSTVRLRVTSKIGSAVLDGGLFALGMPRRSGTFH